MSDVTEIDRSSVEDPCTVPILSGVRLMLQMSIGRNPLRNPDSVVITITFPR